MRKNTYFYRLYPQYTRNMTEKESALYSHYIIDGVRLDMTPAELLDECMEDEGFIPNTSFSDIVDESTEPPLSAFRYDPGKERDYISQAVSSSLEERPFGMLYPEHFTRLQIAKSLMQRLWSQGHFKLGNLNHINSLTHLFVFFKT